MAKDVKIKKKDGDEFAVGWVPDADELRGLSIEDLASELELRMQKAAEKAYHEGFEDFRARLVTFTNSDKKYLW
ncbi:hypothetical protein BA190_09490 [Labrys sp. WJW]|uniref:hypothetical protein n=1 Tax=Labrys sp. WJW TaxID=1737983 RepID=UPI000835432C|nr:hypothetical protein [Labrys sp. WJW]OCC05139.1 hypothetical protein BA190_09490 [Labrys sp. WJW]